jgi:hypothetical protein
MDYNKVKAVSAKIGLAIGRIGTWFLTAAFIMWGWNVVAPHLNAPLFDYWEIFAVRMAFGSIATIFCKNKSDFKG